MRETGFPKGYPYIAQQSDGICNCTTLVRKKNILLTFDYELFQGRKSGTVTNCVIKPTSRLLNILDQFGAKAIFFVDMLYVYRLSEIADTFPKAATDYNLIRKQVAEIANRGHYVYNHLHPHWLDATYLPEENQWSLTNTSKYSLLSLTENGREFVFEKTMTLLKNCLQGARNHNEPIGFRAGGLYIQPFSIFLPYFEKYNIKYDFSVLMGVKGQLNDESNDFDFSGVEKWNYKFSRSVEIEDSSGVFTEFALTSLILPPSFRFRNGFLHRAYVFIRNDYKKYGDGVSYTNKIFDVNKALGASVETYSVELLNEVKLPLYIKSSEQQKCLHLLSHPKLISEYNLRMFSRFLNHTTSTADVEFDFQQFILN